MGAGAIVPEAKPKAQLGQLGDEVHIISGGTKKIQRADVRDAKDFWSNYAET
jgi:hypothetical protein